MNYQSFREEVKDYYWNKANDKAKNFFEKCTNILDATAEDNMSSYQMKAFQYKTISENLEPVLFYKDRCTLCGKCKEVCKNKECILCGKCTFFCPNEARQISGKEYTLDEVFEEIVADKVFYETSGGEVTFSGGECMLQIDFLCEILKKCKENGIHTAVDTAGHIPFEHFKKSVALYRFVPL